MFCTVGEHFYQMFYFILLNILLTLLFLSFYCFDFDIIIYIKQYLSFTRNHNYTKCLNSSGALFILGIDILLKKTFYYI